MGKCTLDPPHFWQNRLVTEIPLSTDGYSMYVGASSFGRRIEGSGSPHIAPPMGTSHGRPWPRGRSRFNIYRPKPLTSGSRSRRPVTADSRLAPSGRARVFGVLGFLWRSLVSFRVAGRNGRQFEPSTPFDSDRAEDLLTGKGCCV